MNLDYFFDLRGPHHAAFQFIDLVFPANAISIWRIRGPHQRGITSRLDQMPNALRHRALQALAAEDPEEWDGRLDNFHLLPYTALGVLMRAHTAFLTPARERLFSLAQRAILSPVPV